MRVSELPPPVEPRQFCRIWFGLEGMSPDDIAEAETESGYRKNCVKLLSKVIGVDERTVRMWGVGLRFEKIPQNHKRTLGYALFALRKSQRRQVA